MLDTLVVVGMAAVSLGTIQEADGVQQRTFWLRNDGDLQAAVRQAYTSCGCTSVTVGGQQRADGIVVQPGDSVGVTLRFNPRGKGGEFHETATVVYGDTRKRVQLTMTGTCITSEETLMKKFPVRVSDDLRLSTNRIDLGRLRPGESRERGVVVLHRSEQNRQERVVVRFQADGSRKGLQHITHTIEVTSMGRRVQIPITLDVFLL